MLASASFNELFRILVFQVLYKNTEQVFFWGGEGSGIVLAALLCKNSIYLFSEVLMARK